jgi:hypothetical protein
MTTVSAYTPATYTFAEKPDDMKFYPFNVAVGLLIDIDVTDG